MQDYTSISIFRPRRVPLFCALRRGKTFQNSGTIAPIVRTCTLIRIRDFRAKEREKERVSRFFGRCLAGSRRLKSRFRSVSLALSTAHSPHFPSSFNLPDPPGVSRFSVFFPPSGKSISRRNRIESRAKKNGSRGEQGNPFSFSGDATVASPHP